MGFFSDMEIEIRERAYELGDDFGDNQRTLDVICEEFNITQDEVLEVLQGEYDQDEPEYDDSMDGDHESALASCGWGEDESYGYFGGDDEY